MVAAVDFAVRMATGSVQYGAVAGDGAAGAIAVLGQQSVSLHLTQGDVVGYARQGADLVITLADGRTIVLSGFYGAPDGSYPRLYLSDDGQIHEVILQGDRDGLMFANYGPAEPFDKWSPLDDLRFGSSEPVVAYAGADETVGMAPFVPGLLAGAGGAGMGGAAAAAAIGGGALLLGGLAGGKGGAGVPTPTVDAQPVQTISSQTASPALPVSGTGQPGDKVVVQIGGKTEETTVGTDGKWSTSFPATNLPADGTHAASVVVTQAGGKSVTLSGPSFVIDMTPPPVELREGTRSVNHVENAEAYRDGVSIGGRGEAGARVEVMVAGASHSTTVGADGSWRVTFTQAEIDGGERAVEVIVVSTDAAGNRTQLRDVLVLDTVANTIQFDTVTQDNTISLAENGAGFSVSGRATPGAVLELELGRGRQTVTAGADGVWRADFPAGTLEGGSYGATLTARSVDAAGNRTVSTHRLEVDTVVTPFTRTGGTGGSDGVVNAAEAANGVTLTGTVEPGATVMVRLGGGAPRAATVDAQGNWSLVVPAQDLAPGESRMAVTAIATDRFGNTASLSEEIAIDRVVTNFSRSGGPLLAGDGILNAAELAAGLTLTGTSEVGSTVVVQLANGSRKSVLVDASGQWSVTFPSAELPSGANASSSVTITATDRAGNVVTQTETLMVDTVAPLAAQVTADSGNGNTILGVATSASADSYSYHQIAPGGAATRLTTIAEFAQDIVVDGKTVASEWAYFQTPVPDGSYLVIRNADAAGNENSSLYVRNTTGEMQVDLGRSGLAGFDFGTIDLSAADASLTIDEATVLRLAGADRQLVVTGNADDVVTLSGARFVSQVAGTDGQDYRMYALGNSGARVLVEDDITLNLTGV